MLAVCCVLGMSRRLRSSRGWRIMTTYITVWCQRVIKYQKKDRALKDAEAEFQGCRASMIRCGLCRGMLQGRKPSGPLSSPGGGASASLWGTAPFPTGLTWWGCQSRCPALHRPSDVVSLGYELGQSVLKGLSPASCPQTPLAALPAVRFLPGVALPA